MVDGADPEVDALFDLAPDEFVAARDALAKARRAVRDREGAAAVKQLRRPSLSAWALNQLARRHGDDVMLLVAQGADLAAAQEEALAGGDVDLRAAGRERTATLRRLIRLAEGILAGRGGTAHRDEVVATLTAASSDPQAGRQLLDGCLVEPLAAPSGFGGPFDAAPADVEEAVSGGGGAARLRLVPTPAPGAATDGAGEDGVGEGGSPPSGRAARTKAPGRAAKAAADAEERARAKGEAAARRRQAALLVAARRAAEEVAAAERSLADAEDAAAAAAEQVAVATAALASARAVGDEALDAVARCRTALAAAVEAAATAADPDGDRP